MLTAYLYPEIMWEERNLSWSRRCHWSERWVKLLDETIIITLGFGFNYSRYVSLGFTGFRAFVSPPPPSIKSISVFIGDRCNVTPKLNHRQQRLF